MTRIVSETLSLASVASFVWMICSVATLIG